ncbi:MAG: cysteine desulfurase DndA [Akkermansiaceae bacterium]
MNPVYLDCNATTPLEPSVAKTMERFWLEEYGNAGSRTHGFGAQAKQAVEKARDQVASVVHARSDEVIFTSGATESNNLALLGLIPHGLETGKRHVITSSIEHKAVLEPLEEMEKQGFEVTTLPCDASGRINPADLARNLRDDTYLVSIMASNNETGVRQPIAELAEVLAGHPAFFHSDAAQAFGKDLETLRNNRLDLISISGHKIYGPKGIGSLIVRRRGYKRVPLKPLVFGGGQERGLRPGTLPVALIAGLGEAAAVAFRDNQERKEKCLRIREEALAALRPLEPKFNGDLTQTMEHVLNLSLPGIDSEALIVALKGLAAISNGSACTSSNYTPSHVLTAMGQTEDEANEGIRISWCHLTEAVDWKGIAERISSLR